MTDNVYILLNARIFTPLNNDNLHTLRRPSNSIHLVVTTSSLITLCIHAHTILKVMDSIGDPSYLRFMRTSISNSCHSGHVVLDTPMPLPWLHVRYIRYI